MTRCTILWVDDDLLPLDEGVTLQRSRLQPWLRWFKKRQDHFRLIEVCSLTALAEALKEAERKTPNDPDYLDAMLIDIMWRAGTGLSGTFELFGFPQESILPMEGGTQFLSLMLNSQYEAARPSWLTCPQGRKIAALSTLVSAALVTDEFLDEDARGRVTVLEKEISEDPQSGLLTPGKNFSEWCEGLLVSKGAAL